MMDALEFIEMKQRAIKQLEDAFAPIHQDYKKNRSYLARLTPEKYARDVEITCRVMSAAGAQLTHRPASQEPSTNGG